jgi:phage gp29-like protein
MGRIVDQYGRPIDTGELGTAQTAQVTALQNQYLVPMLSGLTPASLAAILQEADAGDLYSQHRLFADMEERDTHIACEINKRKLAVMRLDWDIVPPAGASAGEKDAARWARSVLQDAVDPIEDLILALMDGIGHGFAAVEMEWRMDDGQWLPSFWPRPQEWFRLDPGRRELRLLDATGAGAELQPFGWVLHTHGKAKTGYLGRMGLHRALVWPFLYKAYSLGDFAEFLETYGLPIVLGKYWNGASEDEKASLMRAVTALGHDARAIMPADMQIEIQSVTGKGDSLPHMSMIQWAESAISKAILGQVLSSEAKATGMGSGVAALHAEVRHDIRDADARQIAGTITRDLVYPLIALNRGLGSLARCPRWVFDCGDAEDLSIYAEAIPKLVSAGMRTIPVRWLHEKLRIPAPVDAEATLGQAEPAAVARAALSSVDTAGQDALDALVEEALSGWQAPLDSLVEPVRALIERAVAERWTAQALLDALPGVLPQMDEAPLAEILTRSAFVARLAGVHGLDAAAD